MNPEKLIKPAVLKSSAYHVTNAEGLIKLDAMENPYHLPESLQSEWLEKLSNAEINRYPDTNVSGVRKRLSNLYALSDGIDLMFGNGSDELIQIILLALNKESNVVIAPEPTFVMYRLLSSMLELEFIGVPLNQDFSMDVNRMLDAIKTHQPSVIFLAWPNNPTGNCYDETSLEAIIEAAPGLVVIDEAYHAFAQKTMLSSLEKYPNLLLMRTFSKLGLAGLRLGMLFGSKEWIHELNKLRLPYNIGSLNQISAEFMLDNIELLEEQAKTIMEDRQDMFKMLDNMSGIQCYQSEANFILFRTDKNANEIHQALIKEKILIKNLNGSHPLLDNCLRVTVGTKDENNAFLSSLDEVINLN